MSSLTLSVVRLLPSPIPDTRSLLGVRTSRRGLLACCAFTADHHRPTTPPAPAALPIRVSELAEGAYYGPLQSNRRDIEFNLFEVFDRGQTWGISPFAQMDAQTATSVLVEMERLAIGPFSASSLTLTAPSRCSTNRLVASRFPSHCNAATRHYLKANGSAWSYPSISLASVQPLACAGLRPS